MWTLRCLPMCWHVFRHEGFEHFRDFQRFMPRLKSLGQNADSVRRVRNIGQKPALRNRTMPLIYLNDLRLNVRIEGPADGPAVVFLHALGTNLTIWDEVVDLLPKSLRVLRIDQRGHGASDVPEPPYAMGALIRDAERAIEHFGLRDTVVVGLSLGGMVAQGLAVKRLDLVRGMVLSNTAARIGTAAMWGERCAQVETTGLEAYADGGKTCRICRSDRAVSGRYRPCLAPLCDSFRRKRDRYVANPREPLPCSRLAWSRTGGATR